MSTTRRGFFSRFLGVLAAPFVAKAVAESATTKPLTLAELDRAIDAVDVPTHLRVGGQHSAPPVEPRYSVRCAYWRERGAALRPCGKGGRHEWGQPEWLRHRLRAVDEHQCTKCLLVADDDEVHLAEHAAALRTIEDLAVWCPVAQGEHSWGPLYEPTQTHDTISRTHVCCMSCRRIARKDNLPRLKPLFAPLHPRVNGIPIARTPTELMLQHAELLRVARKR